MDTGSNGNHEGGVNSLIQFLNDRNTSNHLFTREDFEFHNLFQTNGDLDPVNETEPSDERICQTDCILLEERVNHFPNNPIQILPTEPVRSDDGLGSSRSNSPTGSGNTILPFTADVIHHYTHDLTRRWVAIVTERLRARHEAGDLTHITATACRKGKTNVRRNFAPLVGQICTETRVYETPSIKRHRLVGKKQEIRYPIEYTFSCFDTLVEKMNYDLDKVRSTIPLLSLFSQLGAEKLTTFKHGNRHRKDARENARKKIVQQLHDPYYREEIVEYLTLHKYYPIHDILDFLDTAIAKEFRDKKKPVHTSLDSPWQSSVRHASNLGEITTADLDDGVWINSNGLTNKVIAKYCSYLNSLNEGIQVFSPRAFHTGDHKDSGHFTQTWAFSVYLKDLNKTCNTFVFIALEEDSSDQSGGHCYLLVAKSDQKTIFPIDINKENREKEIVILSEALDHYNSMKDRQNPWKADTKNIILPKNLSKKDFVCADYALICCEYLVSSNSTVFPESFNDEDYKALRDRIYSKLLEN